jgi:hypothetical protein
MGKGKKGSGHGLLLYERVWKSSTDPTVTTCAMVAPRFCLRPDVDNAQLVAN